MKKYFLFALFVLTGLVIIPSCDVVFDKNVVMHKKEEPNEPKEEPNEPKEEPNEPKEEPNEPKEEPNEPKEEPNEPKEEPNEPKEEPNEPKEEPNELEVIPTIRFNQALFQKEIVERYSNIWKLVSTPDKILNKDISYYAFKGYGQDRTEGNPTWKIKNNEIKWQDGEGNEQTYKTVLNVWITIKPFVAILEVEPKDGYKFGDTPVSNEVYWLVYKNIPTSVRLSYQDGIITIRFQPIRIDG